MSNQYYNNEVLNTSVLVEGIVWQQMETAQNDPNDTFLSADDGMNETEYFSLLADDSCGNETILNDLSGISELNDFDNNEPAMNALPQIFKLEGSDDLFALDVACDDDGNLQRFRYSLRLNDKGEYEGIPETIEMVPYNNDDDTTELTEINQNDCIKKEMVSECDVAEVNDVPDEDSNGLHVNEDSEDEITFISKHDDDDDESCNQIVDSKIGILEEHALLPIDKIESEGHCKVENTQFFEQFDESAQSGFNTNTDNIEHINLDPLDDNIHDDDATLVPRNRNESVAVRPQHVFLTESHEDHEDKISLNSSQSSNDDNNELNESDPEEYEVVEGAHITGDTALEDVPAYVVPMSQQPRVIPKKILRNSKLNYVAKPGKENQDTIPQIKLVKTNPRSILKSSFVVIEQSEPEKLDVKTDKRPIRNKELVQARLFSNYIAQTTIQHAPVRQHRLPRKQTINPVKRNDEEIIVQEVFVSSKGFVETTEDGVVKSKIPLKPTAIVNLSDSDDDYRPRRLRKSPHKLLKEVEIVISDSNDEDSNSVEIISETEEALPLKRRRGRPPKSSVKWWTCENCPKRFPNKTSLETHAHIHKSEKSKYNCFHCSRTFSSSNLLAEHLKSLATKYQCCKKTFTSHTDYMNHKRLHVKDRMIKATDVLKFSPKSTNKSPMKSQHSCYFCSKSFSTADLLKAHQIFHMQFSCTNCSFKFASKLLLEGHVRSKCVKSKRPSLIPRLEAATFKKPQSSSAKIVLPCDSCANKFSSYTELYKHKVLVHNFDTPDKKQVIDENSANKRKSTVAHSNVPANEKLRKAYASLNSKLNF